MLRTTAQLYQSFYYKGEKLIATGVSDEVTVAPGDTRCFFEQSFGQIFTLGVAAHHVAILGAKFHGQRGGVIKRLVQAEQSGDGVDVERTKTFQIETQIELSGKVDHHIYLAL